MRAVLFGFIRFFIVLAIILGIFIALLPTVMSTNWGRKQTVYWINRSIPGNVDIRQLDVHWGKGQLIEGFSLRDPEGQAVLEFDKLSIEATLFHLIKRSPQLGFTEIEGLNAAIVTNERGETNLQRALGLHSDPETGSVLPSTIVLTNVNAEGYLFAPGHPLSLHLTGATRQDNLSGSFEIDFALNGLWNSDWEGLKHDAQQYFSIEGSKEARAQVRVVNFPVDLIDRLAALKNPHLNGFFHALLGDRLNANLDKEPNNEGLAFNLTLLAPLMQGDVKGIIKKDLLSLQEPAVFHFNLTSELLNTFMQEKVNLLKPSRAELTLSQLTIPLNFFKKGISTNPCLFGIDGEFKLPETSLETRSIGNLKILNMQAHMTSPPCNSLIEMKVIGQIEHNKIPLDLHFTSSIHKPNNFSELIDQVRRSMHSNLTISHLPLQIIPFFKTHPEWGEKLGAYANAQLEIAPKNGEEWIGTLSFTTPQLVLKEAKFKIGKEIQLLSPAQVDWTLSPDIFTALFKAEELAFDQAYSLQLILKQFQLPLDHPEATKLELEAAIPRLRLPKLFKESIAQLEHFSFKIKGENLASITSKLSGQFSLFNFNGQPSPILSEPLTFNQTSHWQIEKDGMIAMPSGQLQIVNSFTHFETKMQLNANRLFALTQPTLLQITLSPPAFESFSKWLHKDWPKLQEEVVFKLNIDPTKINLRSFSLSDLHFQGLLEVKKVIFQGDLPILTDLEIPWVFDAPNNNIYTDLKGVAYRHQDEKHSNITAQLQFWLTPGFYDAAHTKTEMNIHFAGMPTSMFKLFSNSFDIAPVVGSIIDLNFKTLIDPTTEKPGYWDMTFDSKNFHVNGRFKIDQNVSIYDLQKPPTFHLTVTPKSYEYLKTLFPFQDERKLASPMTIKGTLSALDIPIKNHADRQGLFNFEFSTSDIQWQNISAPAWKLVGKIFSENLYNNLHLNAKLQSTTTLTINTSLTHFFDQNQHLRHWQEMNLKANLKGEQITISFLQSLLPLTADQTQKLLALLGETFDINASCQLENLSGPLQASAKGSAGFIQLDSQLKQGILTLEQPLEGAVKMTPLFSKTFLTPNVPLLSGVVGAENSIAFAIDPSQFSCPLIPFQMEKVKIGKGHLDLGKLQVRNEGELSSLLSLIRPFSEQYLTIWFTPIYFEQNQGVLTLKRFDMLVGNAYSLANWGTINLMTHRADFILGLSAQALQSAFGVQGLEENYILPIPISSANGKVEVDKKKATLLISSLVAQTHGGTKGKLLGGILDIALTEKGESYPSPTTQPFPWQGEFNDNKSIPEEKPVEKREEKKKKKRKLLDEENIKGLQGEALQLLDQWLK